MNWYFITICVVFVLSLGIELGQHGKPKEGNHSFWIALISVAIELWLIIKAIRVGF